MKNPMGIALHIAILAVAYYMPVTGEPRLLYRFSESQFNDIAGELFGLVKKNLDESSSAFSEHIGTADSVTVSIPRDNILKTVAHFDRIIVMGGVNLQIQGTSFYDYSTQVLFNNCTLISEGKIDSTVTVDTDKGMKTSVQVSGCEFGCKDYSNSPRFGRTLTEYINKTELLRRFEKTVCQVYKVNYDFVFKEKGLKIEIGRLLNGTSEFENVRVRVVDKAVLLTQATSMASTLLPDPGPSYVISEPLPALARQEQPFEVYFTNEAYDEMIDKVRRKVFEGDRPVTISNVIEKLPPKFVQQLGSLIPNLGATFPDSIFDVVVYDMALRSLMTNNSFWCYSNITGDVTATLKCNPNRTFTAFKFTALIEAPAQLAFDHRIVGWKLKTFRGNLTIHDSMIGRIADHFLESMFYVLPQLITGRNLLDSKALHGMRLSNLLPNNFYMENVKIRICEGYTTVGGTLTKTSLEHDTIPYQNLTWVGEVDDLDSFSFPLVDSTPANATGLPVQNCTAQKQAVVSSSPTIGSPFTSIAMPTVFLVIYILACAISG